jgi:hypothetical protein
MTKVSLFLKNWLAQLPELLKWALMAALVHPVMPLFQCLFALP